MGTMSRCKRNRPVWTEDSTHAKRILEGHLLNSVRRVMSSPFEFTREIRRIAESMFRRHARALGVTTLTAWEKIKDEPIDPETTFAAQRRLLMHAQQH